MYQQANVDTLQPTRPYRVVRRIEETADVISLVLEPADGGTLPAIAPDSTYRYSSTCPAVTGNPGSTRSLPPLFGRGCRSLCGGSEE